VRTIYYDNYPCESLKMTFTMRLF